MLTVQQLNKSFNWHKSSFTHPLKQGHWNILSNQFSNGLCKIAQYNLKIIEKIEGSGRTNRGAINASFKQTSKSKETYWIKRLRIASSYGLNDKIGNTVELDDEILVKFQSICIVFM